MNTKALKTLRQERGFTIVELLIVIVVIGILAAIVIVAYNGITKRANAATAKSNAEAVQKVAEAYAADTAAGNGSYGSASTLTSWSGGVSRLPSGVAINGSTLSSSQADGKTIQYVPKGTTGACIGYWDGTLPTAAAVYIYAGDAATGTNGVSPSCA